MATRRARPKPTAFQLALRTALDREWQKSEVRDHEFFARWSRRADVRNLSPDVIADHCMASGRPNMALIDIADAVSELQWPGVRSMNATHLGVVEVVELMTLVLCEREIQAELPDPTVCDQGGLLVLPMASCLAASLIAAAWLKCRVKLVLDERGLPAALNVLTDLPPQEFGWKDVREAHVAELMAWTQHVRGGSSQSYPAVRRARLETEQRRGRLRNSHVVDYLDSLRKGGHADPVFGLRQADHPEVDSGVRVWLADTFGVESFLWRETAANQLDPDFHGLQSFLHTHMEEIIAKVHSGTLSINATGSKGPSMSNRTKVFISYAHKDEEWRGALRTFLLPLENEGLMDIWDDRKIKTGSRWRDEIENALSSAKIAVVLVSPHLLASEFIRDEELPVIFKKNSDDGMWVYPVLISSCGWKRTKLLKDLQIKMCANDAFDLSDVPVRNKYFTEIADEIAEKLEKN